jgi:hypothetical protein
MPAAVARGEPDPKHDVFSLGMTLAFCLLRKLDGSFGEGTAADIKLGLLHAMGSMGSGKCGSKLSAGDMLVSGYFLQVRSPWHLPDATHCILTVCLVLPCLGSLWQRDTMNPYPASLSLLW